MITSNSTIKTETVMPTAHVSIFIGTLYGATWAPLLLLLFAAWSADVTDPLWIETTTTRTTIGLWFGAVGGSLAGLIGGAARSGIDVDREPLSTLMSLAMINIVSVMLVIFSYSAILDEVVGWIAFNNLTETQSALFGIVAVCLGLLLPAVGALRLLRRSYNGGF